MKKRFLLILFIFVSIILVGCNGNDKDNGNGNGGSDITDNGNGNGNNDIDDNGDDEPPTLISLDEVILLIEDIEMTYINESAAYIHLMKKIEDSEAEIYLGYTLSGFNLDDFVYFSNINGHVYNAFIKDNDQYTNYEGFKSKKDLTEDLKGSLIREYSFYNVTEDYFNFHNEDIIKMLTVEKETDEKIVLKWDGEKPVHRDFYNLLPQGFTEKGLASFVIEILLEDDVIKGINTVIENSLNEVVKYSLSFLNKEDDSFSLPENLDDYVRLG